MRYGNATAGLVTGSGLGAVHGTRRSADRQAVHGQVGPRSGRPGRSTPTEPARSLGPRARPECRTRAGPSPDDDRRSSPLPGIGAHAPGAGTGSPSRGPWRTAWPEHRTGALGRDRIPSARPWYPGRRARVPDRPEGRRRAPAERPAPATRSRPGTRRPGRRPTRPRTRQPPRTGSRSAPERFADVPSPHPDQPHPPAPRNPRPPHTRRTPR